jgi:hypothetical protein
VARSTIEPPLILPWRSDRNVHRWYVVAPARNAQIALEEVWAHIGVSHTDFDRLPQVHPGDEVLSVAATLWPHAIITRVTLIDGGAHDTVAAGFRRIANIWITTESQSDDTTRDLRDLLRLHRMALLADDAAECSTVLDELKHRAMLSPVNLLFLEFEQTFRFGTSQDVLDHPEFGRLLSLRRPAAVTDLIARSIDRALLRPLHTESLATVTARYEALEAGHRGLVSSLGECRSSSAVLMAALEARLNQRTLIRQSLSFPLDETTRQALAEVTEERRTAPPSDYEALRERLKHRDYDEVLHLSSLRPTTREKVDAALFAAQQLNSIESAERALLILETAETPVREAVLENQLLQRLINDLRQLVLDGTPTESTRITSWVELFSAMLSKPNWTGAMDVATHGASEWGSIASVDSDTTDAELAAAFQSLAASNHPNSDGVIPHFLTWFWRCRSQNGGSPLGRLAEAVAGYLARAGSPAVDVRLHCNLAEDMVRDQSLEGRLLTVFELLVNRLTAGVPKSAVGPVLDLVAVVTERGSILPEMTSRCNQLLTLVAGRLEKSLPSLAFLAEHLAGQLGGSVVVPTATSEEPTPPASVLLIGPGSLTTPVAHALGKSWPTLSVTVSNPGTTRTTHERVTEHFDLIVTSPGMEIHEAGIEETSATLARITAGGPAVHLIEIERWIAMLI